MSEVLFVSKPIAPPWNDGTRNLVRDVAGAMTRHSPIVMGVRGAARPTLRRGHVEDTYAAGAGSFSVGLSQQAALAARLATGPSADAWHFFFTPSPRVVRFARALSALRRIPSVQTIPSAPRASGAALADLVFAQRVIVLSHASERRLVDAGIAPERLRRVPPAVGRPSVTVPIGERLQEQRRSFGLPPDREVILYAGDLETGAGARCMIDAMEIVPLATLVIASRAKTASAHEAERALRRRADGRGVGDRVRWVGETPRVHELVAAASVVALPTIDLHAKVDLPLVLIEAMHLGRPVIVARGSSAAELAEEGGAVAVDPAPLALAACLRSLLDDRVAARELGQRAMRAADRFLPARVATAYESIYDEVLG